MTRFIVSISLTRELDVLDEWEAIEKFWIALDDEQKKDNTTLQNQLSDSMKIKRVKI